MKRFPPCCVWCLSLGWLLGLAGCGASAPSRIVPDAPSPDAASKAMELYDANHDGSLDAKELEKAPGLKTYLDRTDTSHSGKISKEQIAARIKEWADSKTGRVSISVRIMHNGKPLPDAKVVLAPEKFLGGTIQPGEGTTSAHGSARISSPYKDNPAVRGMSPGFYRVEVTKDGENIPPKYNSDTELGVEVANDTNNSGGPTFDLKY